jgi:hypothetical protein
VQSPSTHTSGHQRREGNGPLGNSSNSKASGRMATGPTIWLSQAMNDPRGSDPGAMASARMAYCSVNPSTAAPRATARNTLPIGLRGRRVVSTAPLVANPGTATTSGCSRSTSGTE